MTRRIVTVTYACPTCEQRVTMRVPVITAICHRNHRAVVMIEVRDAESRARA